LNDGVKRDAVAELLAALPPSSVVIPVQALGELFNVMVRKAGRPRLDAGQVLLGWQDTYATIPTTPEVMSAAVNLVTDHQFTMWDAVILAAASQAGCRLLLSEDLQDGFTWGGVTVVNPFVAPRHALLTILVTQ
jgi:predicted nucleic acid-binding protein